MVPQPAASQIQTPQKTTSSLRTVCSGLDPFGELHFVGEAPVRSAMPKAARLGAAGIQDEPQRELQGGLFSRGWLKTKRTTKIHFAVSYLMRCCLLFGGTVSLGARYSYVLKVALIWLLGMFVFKAITHEPMNRYGPLAYGFNHQIWLDSVGGGGALKWP